MNVELRKLTIDDSQKVVEWRNASFVKKNLYSQEDLTLEQHIDYFHRFVENGLIHQFVILADGTPCGTSFLKNINAEEGVAEFGIFIGEKDFIGKGIGKAAVKMTLKYGFECLKLKSIYLTVLADNISALKSYLSAGFKTSETIQNGYSRGGKNYDVVKMDISSGEFKLRRD